jgi:hypothetical protein
MRNSSRSAGIGLLADYDAMPTSQTPVAPSNADTEVSHKAIEQRDSVRPSPGAKHQEIGGRSGPDPTRFGDWEKNGRCIDF